MKGPIRILYNHCVNRSNNPNNKAIKRIPETDGIPKSTKSDKNIAPSIKMIVEIIPN